VSVESGEKNCG